MRPQQNRRMRGRGNNNNQSQNQNRKGPNPLTRSYESNGPDVKIRGSAQQIAEKYTALARDAQTSGDRVMAENYLQHAEHYNRLIMAFQAQLPQHQQVRDQREDDEIDDEEEGYAQSSGSQASDNEQPAQRENGQPQNRNNGSGPQPVIEGTPAEVALRQASLGQAGDVPESGDQPEAAAAAGDEQEAAPRRARRPRRPRSPRGAEAPAEGGEAGDGGSGEPVTEAAQ